MASTAITEHIDLESLAADAHPPSEFHWQNITVTVKDSKSKQPINILDGISGSARPGSSFLFSSVFLNSKTETFQAK